MQNKGNLKSDLKNIFRKFTIVRKLANKLRKAKGYILNHSGLCLFKIRNIFCFGKPVRINIDGITIKVAPQGAIAFLLWRYSYFEKYGIRLMLSILRPNMVFADIGANTGMYSIAAAMKENSIKIYAFEPCASTYNTLKENIRTNRINNIFPIRSALGNYVGNAVLKINVPWKDGLNTLGRPVHPDSEVVSQETVPITTLDHFIKIKGISKVDIVKADIEGAELLMFQGATELLKRDDGPLFFYENGSNSKGFNYHCVETLWFLEKYGYHFFELDEKQGKVYSCKSSRDANIIAVKRFHPCYGIIKRLSDESGIY